MRLIDPKNPANRLYVSDFVIEQMQKIPTIEAEPVKWIPVTERLPENGELVLAWSESLRDLGMGVLEEFEPTQVTHWMPLPEPPEDGGAENE